MDLRNVFYFKNIVDSYYPDEDRDPVAIQGVVESVQESITRLSDDDFSEVIISCFIPDLYSGMGKCEKLFTKLTELMVGEWWRRIGGTYRLPTKKSGTEDVELKYQNKSIACDAKVFRLGRSQKAPNVKDFLKLASVKIWIDNLNSGYKAANSDCRTVGGLVTYSSLHEWESNSEVYEECSNLSTPVVMLPYEVLAILLKYKTNFEILDFVRLWDYADNHVQTSPNKSSYWGYVKGFICSLIALTPEQYDIEIKDYHRRILLAVDEYRKVVQRTVDATRAMVSREMEPLGTIEEIKEYAINEIERRDNATALDYLKHIADFRSYRDQ